MLALFLASLLLGSQIHHKPVHHKPVHTVKYGKPYRAKFIVTGYNSHEPGCCNITYTGKKVHRGIIAVDPKYIPFGSRIYVPGYGWGEAWDTGGAIKGHHIDVYLTSRHQANRWGLKRIVIGVIPAKHNSKH